MTSQPASHVLQEQIHGGRILVTGFGPFENIDPNPSGLLAECSGCDYAILPVAYAAADAFVDRLVSLAPKQLLCLGVAASSETFKLELLARNVAGPVPDVTGRVLEEAEIEKGGPRRYGTTLFWGERIYKMGPEFQLSLNAGTYLCNYLYYKALHHLPETRVGFLHVPPFSAIAFGRQMDLIQTVLAVLEDSTQQGLDASFASS